MIHSLLSPSESKTVFYGKTGIILPFVGAGAAAPREAFLKLSPPVVFSAENTVFLVLLW